MTEGEFQSTMGIDNLPKIYTRQPFSKPTVTNRIPDFSAEDAEILRSKMELAWFQLQEVKQQLEPKPLRNPTGKDWARMTGAMCQSLELILKHFKSQSSLVETEQKQRKKSELALTLRQMKVMRLAAQELSNEHIAKKLGWQENSVLRALEQIYKVLDVNSKAEAVNFCSKNGIV